MEIQVTNISHGTEGPNHDPYSYDEFTVYLDKGCAITAHCGLGQWIKVCKSARQSAKGPATKISRRTQRGSDRPRDCREHPAAGASQMRWCVRTPEYEWEIQTYENELDAVFESMTGVPFGMLHAIKESAQEAKLNAHAAHGEPYELDYRFNLSAVE